MMLIGSHALQSRAPQLLDRVPSDFDLIGTIDEVEQYVKLYGVGVCPFERGKKVVVKTATSPLMTEIEIAWEGSTAAELLRLVESDPETLKRGPLPMLPSLDVLFALKSSHRYLKDSPHFVKTRQDWMQMREAGAKIPDRYADWYKSREAETYNYSHPNLSQSKSGFFSGDGVKYVYDHDSLHEAVKLFDVPAYTLFRKSGEEVAVDRGRWDRLGQEWKLASVLEESYVLALERSQIPFPGLLTPKQSFTIALRKVCTSITSGWWREYAYEQYDEVLAQYSDSYMWKFKQGVESGLVKRL